MPTIRIPDPIYDLLKEYAEQEHRTVSNAAVNLLAKGLTGTPVQSTPMPKNTILQTPKSVGEVVHQDMVEGERRLRDMKEATTPKKIASEPSGSGAGRDMGDVLADIRNLEADRDEELRFNQDPGDNNKIRERYAKQIQPLWDEYHSMKEPTDGLLR